MDPESQGREVLLKDKFLTVSPRYSLKIQTVAEGKKSLNQVIQLAMSVFIAMSVCPGPY
jgi:hypothetical protein